MCVHVCVCACVCACVCVCVCLCVTYLDGSMVLASLGDPVKIDLFWNGGFIDSRSVST